MFSSLSKNHTPCKQLIVSARAAYIQQNMAIKQFLTKAPNYEILFQINIKLLNHLQIFRKKESWFPENCPCRLCKT